MHGVRVVLPVRGAVRPTHRSGAPSDQPGRAPQCSRLFLPSLDFRDLPLPWQAAAGSAWRVALSAIGDPVVDAPKRTDGQAAGAAEGTGGADATSVAAQHRQSTARTQHA